VFSLSLPAVLQMRYVSVHVVLLILLSRIILSSSQAVAPAVDKKAPAKKKAAQSDNASESSMQLRRQQNLLEESDQYFDWEAFVRWLDAPAPADPRSKEEIAADEQVSRIYSKQNAKRYIAQQQFFDSMLRCQMEAVACLPVPLRERALVFDPILPPVHPRIGAPRQYPIASRLQVERIEDEDDDDKDGKRQTTDDGEEEGGAQHR
jgi:hypothetical protein